MWGRPPHSTASQSHRVVRPAACAGEQWQGSGHCAAGAWAFCSGCTWNGAACAAAALPVLLVCVLGACAGTPDDARQPTAARCVHWHTQPQPFTSLPVAVLQHDGVLGMRAAWGVCRLLLLLLVVAEQQGCLLTYACAAGGLLRMRHVSVAEVAAGACGPCRLRPDVSDAVGCGHVVQARVPGSCRPQP
ncbi:hypothetical protein COO60DRAFT_698380 [Scenedesmus sp. NREL 46B-D3]|nr:hypothetical protein COO60DRAFT_698380 [Scenedesmus sp. NREL 46B-D3]